MKKNTLKRAATHLATIAKWLWSVPGVKSKALSRLIRYGVPGATFLIAIADALAK